MDLRALMQKLETINTTQTLTESVEKRVVITESVATPNRRIEEPTFKSSIARSLVEDFGYELDEEGRGSDEYQAAAGIKPQAAQIGAVGNPWDPQPDPRAAKKAAYDKLSPEQQKWIGGGDPTDPSILARMRSAVPDKPAAAAPAAAAPAAAAPAAPTQSGAATKPAPALVGTQNQSPDAAAQASRIADRMDAEAGANTAGTATPVAANKPAAPQTGAASNMAKDPAQQAQAAAAPAKPAAPVALGTDGKPANGMNEKEPGWDTKTGGSAPAAPQTGAASNMAKDPAQQAQAAAAPAKPAAADPAVAAKREKFKALMDKLEKTGGVTGSAPAVKETVQYEDDQTLLAIKNIRY